MRSLVTGAAGFLGSHLVEKLQADGHEVVALVRNPSETIPDPAEVVVGDITDPAVMQKACRDVQHVYHLAAIPNWQRGISDDTYASVNIGGTRNLAEACVRNGVRRLVFASSFEVMGPSQDGAPLTETSPLVPHNIYGHSKRRAEAVLQEFPALEIVTVRLPSIYGPRNMLHHQRFFRTTQRGFFPLVGDGSALLELCYVKNAVQGLRLAADRSTPGDVYLVSDERSYTLVEVVETIAKELGVKVRFVRMPIPAALTLGYTIEKLSRILRFYPFVFKGTGRPAFSRSSVAWMSKSTVFCDIAKAKRELGYAPPYSLERGVRENIAWYRSIGAL
jgi:nucleoside-diphosphate-sugar epimerase